MQFSDRIKGFKIWNTAMNPPVNIKTSLTLCTSSISSTFKGSEKKIRTRFLDQTLLDDHDIEGLKAMCDKLEDWAILAYEKFSVKKYDYGLKAYDLIKMDNR